MVILPIARVKVSTLLDKIKAIRYMHDRVVSEAVILLLRVCP